MDEHKDDEELVAGDQNVGGVQVVGPESLQIALVRTGSVHHREPLVLAGHERSRSV